MNKLNFEENKNGKLNLDVFLASDFSSTPCELNEIVEVYFKGNFLFNALVIRTDYRTLEEIENDYYLRLALMGNETMEYYQNACIEKNKSGMYLYTLKKIEQDSVVLLIKPNNKSIKIYEHQ